MTMLQLCQIYACANGTIGLNLSRAPWDPYPWVSGVIQDSSAQRAGIRMGDTVLELNGCDILGLKISELASRLREHWQSGADYVSMIVWRNKAEQTIAGATESDEYDATSTDGINQQSLQKFAACLQHIAQLLECPVCLEVIKPPAWQCCNGHVLCNTCRSRSEKCPVCRVPLGPRGRCLLSDKLFTLLAESFPCDGVKTNTNKRCAKSVESSSQNNKCTAEYHNHPKMAFSGRKLNEAKEMFKKTKYIMGQLDNIKSNEVTIVEVDVVKISNRKAQIPKGNELQEQQQHQQHQQQNQQQEEQIETAISLQKQSAGLGIQGAMKVAANETDFLNCAQFRDCNTRNNNSNTSNNILSNDSGVSGATASGSNGEDDRVLASEAIEGNVNNDNVLVKAMLKSSKKSSQITGQDQDELLDDEVANINNGIATTNVARNENEEGMEEMLAMIVVQQQQQQQQQQQYKNYHCPTGKSCCNGTSPSSSYVQTFIEVGAGDFSKLSTTNDDDDDDDDDEVQEAEDDKNDDDDVVAVVDLEKSSTITTRDISLSCKPQTWNKTDLNCHSKRLGRHNSSNFIPAENKQQQEQRKFIVARMTSSTTKQVQQSINACNDELQQQRPAHQLGFHDEWQLLQHLSVAHQLAVLHFYGTYGERLHVPFCPVPLEHQQHHKHHHKHHHQHYKHHHHHRHHQKRHQQQQTIAVFNLRSQLTMTTATPTNRNNQIAGQVEQFFLAVMALDDDAATASASATTSAGVAIKYAIFLWHMENRNANNCTNGGSNKFETIIESQGTSMKWIGRAQPLTRSWSEIRATGQFHVHEISPEVLPLSETFDIIVKMK